MNMTDQGSLQQQEWREDALDRMFAVEDEITTRKFQKERDMTSLFAAQEEQEDKTLVDGVRLWPMHVVGFMTLRRVLGLSADDAKELIEANSDIETIVAQACLGTLLPTRFGKLVNEHIRELARQA